MLEAEIMITACGQEIMSHMEFEWLYTVSVKKKTNQATNATSGLEDPWVEVEISFLKETT